MDVSKLFAKLESPVFAVSDYSVTYCSDGLKALRGDITGMRCYEAVVGRTEPCPFCPLTVKKNKKTEQPSDILPVHDIISNEGSRSFFKADFVKDGELWELLTDITGLYRQNFDYRHSMKELRAQQIESMLTSTQMKSDYRFLMNIVNSMSYGVLVADNNFKILVLNKALKEMTGSRENEGEHCYTVYGNTEPCAGCPHQSEGSKKTSKEISGKSVTITYEAFGDYIVESARDTTREVQLIREIRASQEENEEKQRQMALLNKDLLRMNDQLKIAQNLINEELAQVGALQQSLLPKTLPKIAGYEFGAFYTPAEQAGGDYYDCIGMNNGYWGFAIADVSGHGAPAAVIMAMSRAIMRSYTYDVISSAEALSMVNEILCDNVYTNDFVTMFYSVLDSSTGKVNYASAGHNPVLHFDKSEMLVRKLTAKGMFLAAFPGTEYEENSVGLESGDILFMYTDGLVEAMNNEREQYGLDRVISRIIMYSSTACERIIQELMADVRSFTEGKPFEDDVTIFVLKKE